MDKLKAYGFPVMIMSLLMILFGFASAEAAGDYALVGPGGYAGLEEAVAAVNDGGSIEIKAGQYIVPQLSINKSLIIYSTEGAVLLPATDTATFGINSSWIRVEAGSRVEFNGLTFDGTGRKIYNALYGEGTLIVGHCALTAIQYLGTNGRAMVLKGDDSVVEACTFTQIGRCGIYIYASHNVLLTHNNYTGKGTGINKWLDYGMEIAGGAQATLQANTITACRGNIAPNYSAAILISSENVSAPTQVLIEGQNNINNNLYGIQIGTLANDCSQVRITGNIITNNISSGIVSTSNIVTAESNYWGGNEPALVGSNAVPAWLDTCPWAAAATDENGDGVFDQLAYPLELQWAAGGTDLQLTELEPGATCILNFTAHLKASAPQTNVVYMLEWNAADPSDLTGVTVNGLPLQDNSFTLNDTLQSGQQKTYQAEALLNKSGIYTISLYAVD